jgi:polysaccharide pyruvyl transferase WcaK-like protein
MLLAFDTSGRQNWGARGAHVATYRLLSGGDEDVERLEGHYQNRAVPIDFTLPDAIASGLWRRQDRYWFASAYAKLESRLGARADFIDPRPEVSLRNILRHLDNDYIRGLYDAVRSHDKIVVDGDGDMIFKEEPRRTLLTDLAVIELADHLDKEIYYVNSILADGSVTDRNERLADRCLKTLKKCDEVSFRDPASLDLAQRMDEELSAEWIPDSMFYWHDKLADSRRQLPESGDFIIPYTREAEADYGELDFTTPYICLTGGSRAALSPEDAFDGYCQLVEQLCRLEHPVYLVSTCAGDTRFLPDVAQETGTPLIPAEVPILMGGAILANAHLFVTGRYHPSIMAAAGGTPCVFLGADSHKTRSLQRMLGYDDPHVFSAIPTPDEHDDLLARGRDLLDGGQPVRDRIQQEAQKRAEEAKELATLVNDTPSR